MERSIINHFFSNKYDFFSTNNSVRIPRKNGAHQQGIAPILGKNPQLVQVSKKNGSSSRKEEIFGILFFQCLNVI